MEPLFTLAIAELRRLLEQQLRTDADFDSFIAEYFPDVKRRFAGDADRPAKTQLLFDAVDRGVLSGRLRTVYPDAFAYLLMIEKGNDVGRQFPLPKSGSVVIGRGSDADIRVAEQDVKVSRRHALITLSGSEVRVEKLGKLPIYIEGREVLAPMRLYPGNSLEIHQMALRLHAGSVRASLRATADPRTREKLARRDRSDPESMPAAKESANQLFWGLSDRLLEMKRIDEAERMMSHRLTMVLANAELGEIVEDGVIVEFLTRALRLAQATKKSDWLGWMFDYARILKYQLAAPLFDELRDEMRVMRPAIAKKLAAYAGSLNDPMFSARLEVLAPLCADHAAAAAGEGAGVPPK